MYLTFEVFPPFLLFLLFTFLLPLPLPHPISSSFSFSECNVGISGYISWLITEAELLPHWNIQSEGTGS